MLAGHPHETLHKHTVIQFEYNTRVLKTDDATSSSRNCFGDTGTTGVDIVSEALQFHAVRDELKVDFSCCAGRFLSPMRTVISVRDIFALSQA